MIYCEMTSNEPTYISQAIPETCLVLSVYIDKQLPRFPSTNNYYLNNYYTNRFSFIYSIGATQSFHTAYTMTLNATVRGEGGLGGRGQFMKRGDSMKVGGDINHVFMHSQIA